MVLVHGFAQTGRCWGSLPAALTAEGYAVASPDLPGHGDGPAEAMDLAATAEHILAMSGAVDRAAPLCPRRKLTSGATGGVRRLLLRRTGVPPTWRSTTPRRSTGWC